MAWQRSTNDRALIVTSREGSRGTKRKRTVIKIKKIEAFPVRLRSRKQQDTLNKAPNARPISRYSHYQRADDTWRARWPRWVACVVTAEDDTWGLGLTLHSGPVASIINDHFAPVLSGENCLATEKLWDLMIRMTASYTGAGIPSYAISAIDNALWDLKGKILQRPVYELLGGPQKEKIFCYATGSDTEWYLELGFKATKIFAPCGPDAGLDGFHKNVEAVAKAREMVGDDVELMLDCWMAMDIDYTVRLIEDLKPYHLKWVEEYLPPENIEGYAAVRRRVPWQTLASGEHWYLTAPFHAATSRRLVDILQPDVLWGGGITATVKICHLAEAAGMTVMPHGSMNNPYGQHLVYAMPAAVWGERSEGVSPPGVPLEDVPLVPGTAIIKDGYLVPSDAPGFGLEVTRAWLEEAAQAAK